ncbi:MAG: segregation and condensation protein A [Chromatiales bacterium]|nr:segregation and condensation protein A [Chromatiales bacterium]
MNDPNAVADVGKEREILRAMRLTLAAIIKDVTPAPGMRHPLSAQTVEDVRQCLALIAAREREIGGEELLRPRYVDEPSTRQVVAFDLPDGKGRKN